MNTEDQFLAALQAQPEDHRVRQVFADWLQQQGDPRGELLRISSLFCQPEVPHAQRLEDQVRQLVLQEKVRPVEPLPAGLPARWATSLTQNDLNVVLWTIGGFRGRGDELTATLGKPAEETSELENRSLAGLHALWGRPSWDQSFLCSGLPVISDEIREHFPVAKHARWALGLGDAELHWLLANAAEFAAGADRFFDRLQSHLWEPFTRYRVFRSGHALKSLVEIVRGRRYSLDEYCRRLGEAEEQLRSWLSNESLHCRLRPDL